MRRANALAARIAALPAVPALAVLVALQLAQAFWFAFNTPHNGWIWYSGGDATEYWTEQWAIAHGIIPQAVIGFGLPIFYAWVPLIAGTTLMHGAAIIVLMQAIVLVPLALILFWLVADRLFGRVYAWCAAALWVAGPLLLLHGFIPRYHPVFEDYFLVPHWFGFTNMADLPSLVAVLATCWLTLRWYDSGSGTDAVLGGLLAGLAIGLKPSNGFIFPALLVLLVAARRPKQVGLWAAALVPAVITLALWKYRGLGDLPLTSSSYEKVRVAAGTSAPLAITTSKYVQFDWHHLQEELRDLREVFWSLRFLEFLAVAGAFGVIRKHAVKGAFVVIWFVGYGLFKGSSPKSDFVSANWFRLALPGIPAYILLALGVAFCVPALGRRVAPLRTTLADSVAFSRRAVAIPAIALAVVPFVVVLVAQPSSSMRLARDNHHVNEAPLSSDFHLRVKRHGNVVRLSWDRPPGAGDTTPMFQVYRSSKDDGCRRPQSGSNECFIDMSSVEVVRGTSYVDHPGLAAHWYRVGMLAAYKTSIKGGDLMLLSREAVRARAAR